MTTRKHMQTFNDRNIPVSPLRQKLIEYYENHPKSELTLYKPCYYENHNEYFNLDLNKIEIEADSKLACIIIFKDYLNANLKTKVNYDSYDDDCFYDNYAYVIKHNNGWDKTTFNIDDIFNHEKIDDIIQEYIDNAFDNDTLWFEEVPEKKILKLVI